jgi:hypothetical protein
MPKPDDLTEIKNLNPPGTTYRVNREKYEAMREVLLRVLPADERGLTYDELKAAMLPYLPETLWPGGEKVGWWLKAVQLDLEANGIIRRLPTKPLRWVQSPSS